jgi:hypothetical protein
MMRWTSGARLTRRARAALGGVALVAMAGGARAADLPASAEQLFESARGDMKRGDFAAARDKLIESLNVEETIGTLFNLGLCEEKLGFIQGSLEHVRAALARTAEDDKRRPVMTALIASLERRVSRVVLKRAPESGGRALRLTLDGRVVEASPNGREVLVDPGEHELVVQGRTGPTQTTAIHVDEGATVIETVTEPPEPSIDARADAAPTLVATPPVPSGDGRTRRRFGAVAVNVGGAALIAGAVLGFMTYGSKISVDHHCTATGCDDEGRRASAQGSSYATASTVLTVAGLAGVGMGGYALLGGPAPRERSTARERTVGIIAGSVGVAALAASAIAGGAALAAKSVLLDRCGDSGPCADPQGLDAAARGRTAATVASVTLGVGVAGLGLASYALVLRPRFAPSADVRLTLSPSGIAWAARF